VPPRAPRLLRRPVPGRQRAEQALDELQLRARRVQAQLAQLALQLRLPSGTGFLVTLYQDGPYEASGGSTARPLAARLRAAAQRARLRRGARASGSADGRTACKRGALAAPCAAAGAWGPTLSRLVSALLLGTEAPAAAAARHRSCAECRRGGRRHCSGLQGGLQPTSAMTSCRVVKRGTPADEQRRSRRCAPCCQCIQTALLGHKCKYVTHSIVDASD